MTTSEDLGPDLGAGLDVSAVPQGHWLSGCFKGKPVLLANIQGEYCAVSATCTHLGAPLGKGIHQDGTVRCPWHHARFSLLTGEAVAAPAFDPLTRFVASVRNGRIVVTEQTQQGSPL